jgi:hypothetical protein
VRSGPRLVPKPRRTVGRPTLYSPEIAERFLGYIFEGMTVAAALQHEGMPVKQTILNWTKAHPEFRREYDAASRSAISFGWTSASILQMVRSRREGAVEKPASIPAGSSLPRRQMEPLVGGMTTPMSRPRTGSTSIQFTTSSVNGNLRHGGEAVKVLIDPRVGNH